VAGHTRVAAGCVFTSVVTSFVATCDWLHLTGHRIAVRLSLLKNQKYQWLVIHITSPILEVRQDARVRGSLPQKDNHHEDDHSGARVVAIRVDRLCLDLGTCLRTPHGNLGAGGSFTSSPHLVGEGEGRAPVISLASGAARAHPRTEAHVTPATPWAATRQGVASRAYTGSTQRTRRALMCSGAISASHPSFGIARATATSSGVSPKNDHFYGACRCNGC
jgi:hypothetical protein